MLQLTHTPHSPVLAASGGRRWAPDRCQIFSSLTRQSRKMLPLQHRRRGAAAQVVLVATHRVVDVEAPGSTLAVGSDLIPVGGGCLESVHHRTQITGA